MVVVMDACPIQAWMTGSGVPRIAWCDANVWRSMCGCTCRSICAASAMVDQPRRDLVEPQVAERGHEMIAEHLSFLVQHRFAGLGGGVGHERLDERHERWHLPRGVREPLPLRSRPRARSSVSASIASSLRSRRAAFAKFAELCARRVLRNFCECDRKDDEQPLARPGQTPRRVGSPTGRPR